MSNSHLRIVGALFLAAGMVLAYFFAYAPLEAAKSGAKEVSQFTKILFLTPTTFIFGCLLLALGQKGRDLIQTENHGKQRLTVVGWIVMVICIGAGIGLNEWLKSSLASLGYGG